MVSVVKVGTFAPGLFLLWGLGSQEFGEGFRVKGWYWEVSWFMCKSCHMRGCLGQKDGKTFTLHVHAFLVGTANLRPTTSIHDPKEKFRVWGAGFRFRGLGLRT